MKQPKVKIGILHDVNMDHYAFVRNTRLNPEAFKSQRWYHRITSDGWVFVVCLICIVVAWLVAERPL